MKNNSVKFKHNIPKSSTTSMISEFSCDESPMPNAIQFQSFTHAQTISAKLNKNSVYNQQNIMFNTPRCLAVPFKEIEKDEVLSKTPANKQLQSGKSTIHVEPISFSDALVKQSKYTEESLRKITRLEKFLEKMKQKNQKPISILSSDESPKKHQIDCNIIQGFAQGLQDKKIDPKINKKFNMLMDDLRIIRKNIQYFTPFDGAYSQKQQQLNNFVQLKQQNGLLINNGNHLTKIDLINDTFKIERICDVQDNDSKYISFCICDNQIGDDMIITGSDQGAILGWNYFKNQAYHYYGLNNQYFCNFQQHSQPIFITQSQCNIFIGTKNNELLILDQRMNERKCLSLQLEKQKQTLFRANSIQSPLLPRFGTIIESPLIKPIDANLLNETNFKLEEEFDSIKDDMEEEFPTFKQLNINDNQEIRYIDIHQNNILVTMTSGFIHLDIRNPTIQQFSYQDNNNTALKALFCPGNPDNIIYSRTDSNKCLLWNVTKNEVLFEKELYNNPQDVTVSNITKEILFLHQDQQDSFIKIYDNSQSKLRYQDELFVQNFNIQKILLDCHSESLYGIGSYSLRTWNYFQEREIELIQEEMKHQLEALF